MANYRNPENVRSQFLLVPKSHKQQKKLLLSAKHDHALPTISKRVVGSLFILDKPLY